MGHFFSARVNDILGYNTVQNRLGNYASEALLTREGIALDQIILRRGIDNYERTYGFADVRFGWQQSDVATTGEEFADMFLGWNYNEWAPRGDRDYGIGQARSNFMDRYMAPWIALVINRERQQTR